MIDERTILTWTYVGIFIITAPIFIYGFMIFGSRKIAIHKAKKVENIKIGCLYYDERLIRSNVSFILDAPNDHNLPLKQGNLTFFAIYDFPVSANSFAKYQKLKLDSNFCNKVQFVGVDFGIKKYYFIYDILE